MLSAHTQAMIDPGQSPAERSATFQRTGENQERREK
jgi:hypothetical protein